MLTNVSLLFYYSKINYIVIKILSFHMVNMLSVDKYLKKAKVSIIKGNISEAKAFYKLILQNYPENKRAKEGLEKINDGNRYNYNGI